MVRAGGAEGQPRGGLARNTVHIRHTRSLNVLPFDDPGRMKISKVDIIQLPMSSILIHLDEPTLELLNRATSSAKRKRAQFIRDAIRRAAIEAEEARTREAYLRNPDSESEADDWSNAEEFKT